MPDIMQEGATALAADFQAWASGDLTLDDGTNQVTVQATFAETQYENDELGDELHKLETTAADFIIDVALYDFDDGNGAVAPLGSHRYSRTIAGVVHTYKPVVDDGKPAARHDGPHQTSWRIQTRLVGKV